PCGWVDISLSITSAGPSSFDFPDIPRLARWTYAFDKENRIHRGEILCTIRRKISWEMLRGCGLQPAFSGHHNVRPPSTTSTWPVMNFECTRNKTASAISDGFPERRSAASLMKSVSHSGGSPGMEIGRA